MEEDAVCGIDMLFLQLCYIFINFIMHLIQQCYSYSYTQDLHGVHML